MSKPNTEWHELTREEMQQAIEEFFRRKTGLEPVWSYVRTDHSGIVYGASIEVVKKP